MELRDLAEQIVFATTLEEKLRCPDSITDEHPGASRSAPASPGRPTSLHFKASGAGTSDFPGLHRLEQETERGRLLHFFANHELLATELMALVLLRFPDAPAAFRRGVLATLKEEQAHTRLYLERMRAYGIEFGDLPVSGYFWRSVAPMEHPMDYVAALSLTFEQANLDFCRHFAQGFQAVGDSTTARLLEGIYRDEIAHVAYGLKWFRRWKNPDLSDWDAFCRQLKFPLSPNRAKGSTLNFEGRRAAGFDGEFIDALNVYSHSKGRTPSVFVFNPLAEGRIAYGARFTPRKQPQQLARDLANLPQFLCRQDDVVLVPKRPSIQFLSRIKQAGIPLPEFVEYQDPTSGLADRLGGRKLGRLRPWAWGPDSVELLAPLFSQVTGEQRSAPERFHPRLAELYSKAWSAAFLRRVWVRLPEPDWLCSEAEMGVEVRSLSEAEQVVARIRGAGHHRIVVKEGFGLAGQSSVRLWEPKILDTQRRWMESALELGQTLVVEPWLERVVDFSVQLECGPGGLKLRGYTGLLNDAKGQFHSNWAAPHYEHRPPTEVGAALDARGDAVARVHGIYRELIVQLSIEFLAAGFVGPVGIDAFVYRGSDGRCRLKPIVEINPRYTMGRLTLELMAHTVPGSWGQFRILNPARVHAEGAVGFLDYAARLEQRSPIIRSGAPVLRIAEGAICLNDPAEAKGYLATFQVARLPLSVSRQTD